MPLAHMLREKEMEIGMDAKWKLSKKGSRRSAAVAPCHNPYLTERDRKSVV